MFRKFFSSANPYIYVRKFLLDISMATLHSSSTLYDTRHTSYVQKITFPFLSFCLILTFTEMSLARSCSTRLPNIWRKLVNIRWQGKWLRCQKVDDTEKWSLDVIVVVIDVIIEVMHKHVIARTEHNLHSIELWCHQVIVVSIVLREIGFSSFSQTIDLPFFCYYTSLYCEPV